MNHNRFRVDSFFLPYQFIDLLARKDFSDSLLATNRFVTPLPMAQVWVLATYYAAQALIVAGMLRGTARAEPSSVAALTPQTDLARSPSAA